jgi:Fe-S cluster assembly iron-binding protein IscA
VILLKQLNQHPWYEGKCQNLHEAQIYVADLFAQQGEEDLGLKVDIEKAGTPAAAVTFNFCYEKDLGKNYFKFEYKGFNAFIDEANFDYLKDSEVALKEEGSSKKLTITASIAILLVLSVIFLRVFASNNSK